MTVNTMKDAPQVLRDVFDEEAQALRVSGGKLVPESFDTLELTYVAAGNGAGEIETVTYIKDLAVIATLTLSYNSDNKLVTVTRV
jgi:hypothetical protein